MDKLLSECRFSEVTKIFNDNLLSEKEIEQAHNYRNLNLTINRNDILKLNKKGEKGFRIHLTSKNYRSFSVSKDPNYNLLYSKTLFFIKEMMDLNSIDDIPLGEERRERITFQFNKERVDNLVKKNVSVKKIRAANYDNSLVHRVIFTNGEEKTFKTKELTEKENLTRVVEFLEKTNCKNIQELIKEYYDRKLELENATTIPEYSKYKITQKGKVFSQFGEPLKPAIVRGYKVVSIVGDDGIKKSKKIHRLVAKTFLDPVEGKEIVNHLDEKKLNNEESNLQLCTNQENVLHSKQLARERKDITKDNKNWETIPGHPKYKISRDAKIFNTKTSNFLKHECRNVRKFVKLDDTRCYIDELLAITFIKDDPNFGLYVAYDDGNPNNLNASNIKWSEHRIMYKSSDIVEEKEDDYNKYKWKSIPELANYEFSSCAKIYSHFTKKFLVIPNINDYINLRLVNNNGEKDNYYLHRLIAKAWVENDDPVHKTVVDHINDPITDNRACNLQWLTPGENIKKGKHKNAVKVRVFDENRKLVGEYESIAACIRQMKEHSFNDSRISKCIKSGKIYKGFYFEKK